MKNYLKQTFLQRNLFLPIEFCITDETVFECVQRDPIFPDKLQAKFSNFPLIFKTIVVEELYRRKNFFLEATAKNLDIEL